ncbi:hypothetical protein CQ13_38505 [Bradyrhizobium retamae]|uniref:Uncharacterized protein n=1 Tax=Bradyrhizobium retamae TaxID=1300035 RepID=A0A0R3NB64_9BRAD|nr:hypothetical protein CQ13_38505 [Bradyrhizobium retamae]
MPIEAPSHTHLETNFAEEGRLCEEVDTLSIGSPLLCYTAGADPKTLPRDHVAQSDAENTR